MLSRLGDVLKHHQWQRHLQRFVHYGFNFTSSMALYRIDGNGFAFWFMGGIGGKNGQ